jgi:hypothetical protein
MLTTALSIFIDSQVYIKKQSKTTPTPKSKIKNKKSPEKQRIEKVKRLKDVQSCILFDISS